MKTYKEILHEAFDLRDSFTQTVSADNRRIYLAKCNALIEVLGLPFASFLSLFYNEEYRQGLEEELKELWNKKKDAVTSSTYTEEPWVLNKKKGV